MTADLNLVGQQYSWGRTFVSLKYDTCGKLTTPSWFYLQLRLPDRDVSMHAHHAKAARWQVLVGGGHHVGNFDYAARRHEWCSVALDTEVLARHL